MATPHLDGHRQDNMDERAANRRLSCLHVHASPDRFDGCCAAATAMPPCALHCKATSNLGSLGTHLMDSSRVGGDSTRSLDSCRKKSDLQVKLEVTWVSHGELDSDLQLDDTRKWAITRLWMTRCATSTAARFGTCGLCHVL